MTITISQQITVAASLFSLPLEGRAGVGGIPARRGFASEADFERHGGPPSLPPPRGGRRSEVEAGE